MEYVQALIKRREIGRTEFTEFLEIDALGPDSAGLGERVLQALRAENGPFPEGRELAIVVRCCLAELRRLEETHPIRQAAGW
ncbi:MAG: hypothetical protein ACRDJF_11750 [Actinomycetota bacterium]